MLPADAPPPADPPARRPETERRASSGRASEVAIYAALAAIYVASRVVAVWGRGPIVFPDTAGYRVPPGGLSYGLVSLLGHAPRMWTLPAIYALLPGDQARLAFQVAVSIVAWVALAGALASVLRSRPLRIVAVVVVLALGATPQVTTWDLSMLAESLSISLTVAAVAAWLRVAVRPRPALVAVAVGLTGLWLFTRPYLYPFALGIALIVGLWAWRGDRRALKAVGAGVLVVLAGWSLVASGNVDDGYRLRDDRGVSYVAEAFAQNLFKRYLNDAEATAYFRSQGMPDPTGLTPSAYPASDYDDYEAWAPFYAELRTRPEWMAWLDAHAGSAFAGYVRSHPGAVLSGFERGWPPMLRSAVNPVYGPAVEAKPVSTLGSTLFFRGDGRRAWHGDVTLWVLAAVALAIALVARRTRPLWPVVVVGLTTTGVGGALLFVSWLGSAYEVVRHAAPAAHLVRVGLVVVVFALADALIASRRPTDADEPVGVGGPAGSPAVSPTPAGDPTPPGPAGTAP